MSTPGSGGSNTGASLEMDVGTNAPEAVSELDALNATVKTLVTSLDALGQKLDATQAKQERVKKTTVELTTAQKEEQAQRQASIELQAEADRLAEKQIADGNRIIAQLDDMIAIYGKTKIEVLQYRAELAEVGNIARPLTEELKALTRATFELETQQKRDIETLRDYQTAFANQQRMVEERDMWLHGQRGRDYADYISWWEKTLASEQANQEKMVAIAQSRDVSNNERLGKKYAEYIAWWEKTLAAEEANQARIVAIEQSRDVELNNMRNQQLAAELRLAEDRKAISQNRDVEMHNARVKAVEEEMKLTERQALLDIRYAQMTTEAKIRELEKLKAYQAAAATGALTPETMANNFGPAILKDLPNLSLYKTQLAEAEKALSGVSHATEGLNVTNKSFARELIVIGHEFVNGNWSRIPGSFMVLGERMNAAALLFSGMGIAALGAVAGLGAFVYATAKAVEEQQAMNNAMILTNNYAGMTESRMVNMAAAIANTGQNIGKASEAVTALTASGKFTADQIGTISEAIVGLERTTGYSIGNSVKNFESLQVKVGDSATAIKDKLLQSMLKLDDQFHYLDSSMINQIITLTRLGETQKASELATDQFAAATKRMADEGEKNLGYFAQRWHELRDAVTGAIHAMGEWGKTQTTAMKIADASARIAQMDAANPAALQRASLPGQGGGSNVEALRQQQDALRAKEVEKLTALIEQQQKEQLDAQNRGQLQQLQSKVNFYKISDEHDVEAMKRRLKGEETTQEKITQLMTRVSAAKQLEKLTGEVDPQYSDEAVAKQIELIKKTSEKKVKAASDGRKQVMLMDMADANAEYSLLENNTKAEEALIKESMRMKETTTEDGYAQIRLGRTIELAEIKGVYDKQKQILEDYNAKDARDKAEQVKRLHLLANAYNEAKGTIQAALVKNDEDEKLANYKEQEAVLKRIAAEGKSVADSLQKQIDKEKLHNAEIGKTKEQIELAKKAQQDAYIADLQNQADAYQYAITNLGLSKDQEDAYTLKLQQIQTEIALRKQLAQVQDTGVGLEANSPDAVGKLADEAAKKWKKAGEDIKKSLKDAFGGAGESIGGMFQAYAEGQAKQIKIDEEFMKKKKAAEGTWNEDKRVEIALQEKQYEQTQNQMHAWGGMADAAANYFDQSSTGYKTLHAVAQVFHAAEMAMLVIKMGQQAISAVLNQGQGDPYTAFARMAAMAAVVTGLGVAISASQAGAQRTDVAKNAQAQQGTGTVLGDATAKSNSIQKSLDLIGSNSDITLKYTSQMAQSLHNIEGGIGGLANIIYRTTGMTTATNMGIVTGVTPNKGDPVANALGLGGLADKLLLPGLSGIVSKLQSLWGNTTTTIVDTGLQIQGSINDLKNGQGVDQYANVENKKTSWFGLVKDYSYDTVTQNAGSEIAQQFGQIFSNLNTALTAAGGALGMSTQRLQDALGASRANVDPTSFKDLKGQELVDALNAVVSKASDQISQSVLPGMESFMQVGEGYAQTAVRVASGVEKAQMALQKLGISAINYTDIANKQGDVEAELVRQSIVARETTTISIISWQGWFDTLGQSISGIGEIMNTLSGTASEMIASYQALVEVRRIMNATNTNPANNRTGGNLTQQVVAGAGSLDALSQGSKDFLDKYYTDAEKIAIETKNMSDQFDKLGMQLPKSKDEFRTLLTGIDLTTDSGQKLYGQLITLSGGFASLMDSVANASQTTSTVIADQLTRVNELSTEAQRWLSVRQSASSLHDTITTNMGQTPDTTARQQQLWAMLALGDKISPEQQLSLATELQDLILKKYQIDKTNATDLLNVAKSLRTYLDGLKVGDLAPGTNTDKLNEAKAQYDATLTKAQGGDTTAAQDLQNKASAYLTIARDYFASSDQYKQIFAGVYASLDQYAVTAASAEDLAAQGNVIAQGQLDELGALRDVVSNIMQKADDNYAGLVTTLQTSINNLQQIYSILNVTSTVPDILRGLPADLSANLQQSLGGIIQATGSQNDALTLENNAIAAEGNRLLQAIAEATAKTANNVTSPVANTTNSSGGAVPVTPTPFYQLYFQHANGQDFVPYDGYKAELHRGERVLTAKQNEEYTFGNLGAADDEKVLTSTANRGSIGAGNSGASNNAMAQEIKALREELAALRKDQAQQHQESIATNYDANDRAANKVAGATCDAADKANWARRSAAPII